MTARVSSLLYNVYMHKHIVRDKVRQLDIILLADYLNECSAFTIQDISSLPVPKCLANFLFLI